MRSLITGGVIIARLRPDRVHKVDLMSSLYNIAILYFDIVECDVKGKKKGDYEVSEIFQTLEIFNCCKFLYNIGYINFQTNFRFFLFFCRSRFLFYPSFIFSNKKILITSQYFSFTFLLITFEKVYNFLEIIERKERNKSLFSLFILLFLIYHVLF